MIKRTIIVLMLICSSFISSAVSPMTGTTLSDNFKSGPKNWDVPSNRHIEIVDGQLTNKTVYASGIALKEKEIGSFTLTFKLKFLKNSEISPGHFSIGIARDYGTWMLYFTTNANQSQITSKFIPKCDDKKVKPLFDEVIHVPLPLEKWLDAALICNNEQYELKIGDKSFVLGTAPGKGGISFGSYKQPFAMEDFKLTYSNPEGLSTNLLVNSSFEYASNPDIPDYWAGNGERYRSNGLPPEYCTAEGIREFHEKFSIDRTQAFDGKLSIRLESPFHLISMANDAVPKKDYMVSCYIKSDRDACDVTIGATNDTIDKPVRTELIKAGKSWQRYELPLSEYPKETISFFVKPTAPGKIWVDAVQLEEGKIATQYRQCWMDAGFNLPYDVNKNQCNSNVNGIKYTLERNDNSFSNAHLPMRIYSEYSFYTDEAEARIVTQFDVATDKMKNCKLEVEVFGSAPAQAIVKNSFEVKPSGDKQICLVPIKLLTGEGKYTVKARVVNRDGQSIMQSETELIKRTVSPIMVKINRINRGVYVNGTPFFPNGIQTHGLGEKQLQYYRGCGFNYIQLISTYNTVEKNLEFLANCEKLGILVTTVHLTRKYTLPPFEAIKRFRSSPALVGMIPNDESAEPTVYEEAMKTKDAYPEIITWVNQNFHSYRAFARRAEGFPGDVLSIDRYPFILQPPGRPQTTNDIYSIEQCMEMMDLDSLRNRKPVFLYLQAAERFAKEPTPEQLTWQTYIPLVNHCMGFTYFGGMPNSERVWTRMIELNKEIQTLTPALFSLEDEPAIAAADQTTKENIRFMAKKLGNELTVICVNRTLYPVDASLDLSSTGFKDSKAAEVIFENRNIRTSGKGVLKDQFKPLERHVYKIKSAE